MQGFTLIELLVVIAIISIIAGFLVPTLLKGREEAYTVKCANQLKQVYTFALDYSDKRGGRAFPIATGEDPPAHESINKLIAFTKDKFSPQMFVCPSGEAGEAEVDDEGLFVLDSSSNSYAWVRKRTKNTKTNTALASDKYVEGWEDDEGEEHSGHAGGLNVLMTDGSVHFKLVEDLPEDNGHIPPNLTR